LLHYRNAIRTLTSGCQGQVQGRERTGEAQGGGEEVGEGPTAGVRGNQRRQTHHRGQGRAHEILRCTAQTQ